MGLVDGEWFAPSLDSLVVGVEICHVHLTHWYSLIHLWAEKNGESVTNHFWSSYQSHAY